MENRDDEEDDASALALGSLAQVRAFCEVARLGSISHAAGALRRSQSAVTQAIKKLETEAGVKLLRRAATGSYLTDSGEILRKRADRCLGRIDSALMRLLAVSDMTEAVAAIARRVTRAQITALAALHETGSFVHAARLLGVSLPSVHRSARALEKHVGRALLQNTPQGTVPNSAGASLSIQLNLALRELEWAIQEIRAHEGQLGGRLLVGSRLLAGNHFISVGLDRFSESNPRVTTHLVNGSRDGLVEALRRGSIDYLVGLLEAAPPSDDLAQEVLMHDPYVIVAGKEHALAKCANVTLEQLCQAEWVAPAPRAQRRAVFNALFEGRDLPHFTVETHSLITIMVLMARNRRVSLLTRSEAAVFTHLGEGFAILDFEVDAPAPALGLMTRTDWEPTGVQLAFREFLRGLAVTLQTDQPAAKGLSAAR